MSKIILLYLLTENPNEIKVYKNSRYQFEANLMESLVKSFAGRYSAVAQIAHTHPAALEQVLADPKMDFVQTQAVDRKRQPGSLDYYAVTMLTLILMYASLTGLWSVKNEKNFKTGRRILASPVTKYEFLAGKISGGILITILQAVVVILFSQTILKAYWGTDIVTVILVHCLRSYHGNCPWYRNRLSFRITGALSCFEVLIPIFVFLGGDMSPTLHGIV
jgi:ABC-2 type transport system permease protein